MEGEKKAKNGTFNQDPHMILYGMPNFSIQDKWALLALMGMCWDRRQLGVTLKDLEGPYKLSLREIAAITGIKHNALRSTGGKDPRIGVLDRWQEIGYLTVIEARPIDEVTGKPGRLQTYLYVHLERIWTDNAAFTETWHRPPGRLVEEASFERIVEADTVHVVNTQETPLSVHHVNTDVHTVNTDVHTVNSIGHHVNVTVHDTSSKSDPIQSNKDSNKDIQERMNGNVTAKQETSHSSIHSSSHSQFSSSQETKPEEVILSEEEQRIYDFGCQTIFKAKPPTKTAKLKGECAELGTHITTLEQFQSLLQFVRALPYIQGQVHLKNLVNELNGWLQSLEAHPTSSSRAKPRGPVIVQEPTQSEQEAINKKNEEQLAKMLARNAARQQAQQQEGVKA